MDNDSDTEEQLQKDILQINEILGNDGDEEEEEEEDNEDDDGIGAEFDLQIDEPCELDNGNANEHDEVVVPVSLFVHDPLDHDVHQDDLGGEECAQESPTDITDAEATSEGNSLQQLLSLNQENQQNLKKLLVEVRGELQRNQKEQDQVSANPNDTEPRNVDLSVRRVIKNYLLFATGKTPPDNADTRKRKAENMPTPFDIPQKTWRGHHHQKLMEGVKLDGSKSMMQPLLNRQEVLEQKMDKLSVPQDLENVYQEMQQIKKKLARIEHLPTEELLGDRFRRVDWDFVANVDLEEEHTAEACQSHWQNWLHPSINHKEWSAKEEKELMEIASENELRNWEAIAEELGTRRTAIQCLRKYQKLDKTFTNSDFTKADDALLRRLVERFQIGTRYVPFNKVAYFMEGRTSTIVSYRYNKKLDASLKSGKWSQEEIEKLKKMVKQHGAKNWSRLADAFPGRSQFQIRDKWVNRLNPGNKFGSWSYPETYELLKKTQQFGIGNWSRIAEALKKPGKKRRTPISIYSRFKQVFSAYCKWLALYSKKENGKETALSLLNHEEVYSGKFLPDLVAFLKKKEEVEKRATLAKNNAGQKKSAEVTGVKETEHPAGRTSSNEESPGDEEVNNREESLASKNLTPRQKALALKKTQDEANVRATQQTDQEIELSGDEEMPDEGLQQEANNDDDSGDAEEDSDSDFEEASPSKHPKKRVSKAKKTADIGVRPWMNNLKKQITDRANLSLTTNQIVIPAPYTTMLHVEGKISLQELQQRKQQNLRKQQQQQQEEVKRQWESVFDVSTSMEARYQNCSGRPRLTELDLKLIDAVDPQWLYKSKTLGRNTKHCIRAQQRTGQGKLSRPDQKAMFRLLLQVFDVDMKYTTILAAKSLAKSSKNAKKPSADGDSEELKEPGVTTNTHVESKDLKSGGQEALRSGQIQNAAAEAGENREQVTISQEATATPNRNYQPGVNGELNGMITVPSGSVCNRQTVQSKEPNPAPSPLPSPPHSSNSETSNPQNMSSVHKSPTAGPQAYSGQVDLRRADTRPQAGQSLLQNVGSPLHILANASLRNIESTGATGDAERVISAPQRALINGVHHSEASGSRIVTASTECSSPSRLTVGQQLRLKRRAKSIPYERKTINTMGSKNCTVPQFQLSSQASPQAGVGQSQSNALLFQPGIQGIAPRVLAPVGHPQNPTVAPAVQAQCLLLRNNQTGQLVLHLTPSPAMPGGHPTPQYQGISNLQPAITPMASTLVPGTGFIHRTPILHSPQAPHALLSSNSTVPQHGIQPHLLLPPAAPVEALTQDANPLQLVRVVLRDGSKVVLTRDDFRSFKDDLLGNTTCSVTMPNRGIQCVQGANQFNKAKTLSETSQKPSLPIKGQCSQKKQEKQEEKTRKLHTRDIALLPPNVATLQALVFLLLDRKNLECQQKKFISHREKEWKSLQKDKLQRDSFTGYLESRNRGHGELSQAGTTSMTSHGRSSESTPESIDSHQSAQHEPPEDILAPLRNTDMYQVLQKRFLSLFLWPGLLSSTRIKGSIDKKGTASYYNEELERVEGE